MKTIINILFIMIISGCSNLNNKSNDIIHENTEGYETYSYENFSIQLPSEFLKHPTNGDSNVFLFETKQNNDFISYERCVPNPTNLNKMNDLQVIDIIFQSSAFYPEHYSDFYPEKTGDSPPDWITFKKKNSNGSYAAFFRVVDRKNIDIPKMVSAQLIFYEIKRQSPGTVTDGNGRTFSPWKDYKNNAFVIDSGVWKYVFKVGNNLDEDTLDRITKGIMEFKEIFEPNNLDQ